MKPRCGGGLAPPPRVGRYPRPVRARIVAAAALALLTVVPTAAAERAAETRVTVFGDSAATAMAYDPDAKRILARGVDLRLEVAACRRVGDTSCPYDGVRPPNVIERGTELGAELGPVVVVIVGYNDYETRYAENIDRAMAVFRKAGVEHVLWTTLRAVRQSYVTMNDAIAAAARRHPQLGVLDWNALSRNRDDWVQGDGIHLTAEGARRMAAMVSDALVQIGAAPRPAPATLVRPLAIPSQALPVGRRGRPYAARLRAVGGTAPYRWARVAGAIAPGLRLTASGRVQGVPVRAGTYRLTVRVSARAGARRTRAFVLRIL